VALVQAEKETACNPTRGGYSVQSGGKIYKVPSLERKGGGKKGHKSRLTKQKALQGLANSNRGGSRIRPGNIKGLGKGVSIGGQDIRARQAREEKDIKT